MVFKTHKEQVNENKIHALMELGYDQDALEYMESWSFDEAKAIADKWCAKNVNSCIGDWDKETIMKGYAIFDGYNIVGAQVIQRIDILNGFDGDEDAAKSAEKDSIKIAWDLIAQLELMGCDKEMYIDIPENRKIIEKYISQHKDDIILGGFQYIPETDEEEEEEEEIELE